MKEGDDEESLLRSVALRNAKSILQARQRAEDELLAAKEALSESSERVTDILESITDGFIAVDSQWRFTYLNPRGLDTLRPLQGSRENMLGQELWQRFPDLGGTLLEQQFHHAMNERITVAFDFYYPALGRWFQMRAYPAKVGLSIYFQDITRRKTAEEDLREKESFLRATFAQAAVGMAVTWPDGRFLEVNQKFVDILGYSFAELQRLSAVELTYPDDVQGTRDRIKSLIEGAATHYTHEKRFVGKDGAVVWALTSVTLLRDALGKPSRLVAVIEDITKRVHTEEALREGAHRLQIALDTGRMGDWAWVAASDQLTMGARAAELFDVPPGAALTRAEMRAHLHPDDREMARIALDTALATGTDFDVEYRVMRKDQVGWRWVAAKGRGTYSGDGVASGMTGVMQDVSERKRAAEEREQLLASERAARAYAERTNSLKDEFLATLSHELRTPLSAILGWAQALRSRHMQEDELHQGLEKIERNARVQARLIEDLLDMSRIESGKVRLDVQPVQPISFVEAAVETVRPAANAKGIRLEKLLDPAAGPIYGDPQRLQQIVWNLLSNAIKFTPREGRVQIVLERVNSHVEITVADTGIGVRAEFLPHVFDRFRQADASTTRKYGGLGLGLSIVKHLVELHGGTVRAKSDGDNCGATFSVHLPLTVVHGQSAREDRVHPRTPVEILGIRFKAMNLAGIKVLVVDDEPDSRELIKRVLNDCDAEVHMADNAADALSLVESERPHVLVSDIGMPGIDGYELLRRVRALGHSRGGGIPAVALTAFARSEDRTRALQAGFQVHVSKPVEPMELIATVANAAGRAENPGAG